MTIIYYFYNIFRQSSHHCLRLQRMSVNYFTVYLIQFYHPHPKIFNFIKVLTDFQTDTYIKLSSVHIPNQMTSQTSERTNQI